MKKGFNQRHLYVSPSMKVFELDLESLLCQQSAGNETFNEGSTGDWVITDDDDESM